MVLSERYQDLCYAETVDSGHESHVILQFNLGQSGAWRTHSSKIIHETDSLIFKNRDSTLIGRPYTQVVLDYSKRTLNVEYVVKKLFGGKIEESSLYVCKDLTSEIL